jgi:hypothetical protein
MSENRPTPQSTLAIIFGASEWPDAPDFTSSDAFKSAAWGIREYLTLKFGIPDENLLDLFDQGLSPYEIDREVSHFLQNRLESENHENPGVLDLIVYFVGHGGFDSNKNFYLAIKCTNTRSLGPSSVKIHDFAVTLKERARFLRCYVILDCCFAASANVFFQSSSAASQAASQQALDAFAEVTGKKTPGLPTRGTSLLCSSRHNTPSQLNPDQSNTMFSEALLSALDNGADNLAISLDLRNIHSIINTYLREKYQDAAPRPELHSPDQSQGDLSTVPLFPNRAFRSQQLTDNTLAAYLKKCVEAESYAEAEARVGKLQDKRLKAQYSSFLGRSYAQKDKFEDAERCFRNALEYEPGSAERDFELGMSLFAQEKWAEATKNLKRAHERDPVSLRYEHYYQRAESRIPPPAIDRVIKYCVLAVILSIPLGIIATLVYLVWRFPVWAGSVCGLIALTIVALVLHKRRSSRRQVTEYFKRSEPGNLTDGTPGERL